MVGASRISSKVPLPLVGTLLLPFLPFDDLERDDDILREFVEDSVGLEDPFRNLGGLTLPFSGLLVDLLFILEGEVGLLYPDLLEEVSFSLNVNCLPLFEAGDGFILTDPFLFPDCFDLVLGLLC